MVKIPMDSTACRAHWRSLGPTRRFIFPLREKGIGRARPQRPRYSALVLLLAAMLAELRSLASVDTAQPLRVGQLDNVPLDASSSFGEIFANKIVLNVRETR